METWSCTYIYIMMLETWDGHGMMELCSAVLTVATLTIYGCTTTYYGDLVDGPRRVVKVGVDVGGRIEVELVKQREDVYAQSDNHLRGR